MKTFSNGVVAMLTVDEVAKQLSLSPRTVHRLIECGAIFKHQFGRAVRISVDDLNSYIAKSRK